MTKPFSKYHVLSLSVARADHNLYVQSITIDGKNFASSAPEVRYARGWDEIFNGWKHDIMETFTRDCSNRAMDCQGYLLGDGRTLNG